MHPSVSVKFKLLFSIFIPVLIASASRAQNVAEPIHETAASWKSAQLATLEREINEGGVQGAGCEELLARKTWLTNWTAGNLSAKPPVNTRLPKVRMEPVLSSVLETEFRQKVNWDGTENDAADLLILDQAMVNHPGDLGLLQLSLHWLDLPIRRKAHLKRIDELANRLIKSLSSDNNSVRKNQLAIEFAMYRRGRALAYRELPDVVKQMPNQDPERLNQEISRAFRELIESAGSGRSEFILLEIRVLRRAKSFGQALALVEKYGAVIQRKWYLKKRRDLLKELQWEIPFAEAAKIYAAEFPEEVAKESR